MATPPPKTQSRVNTYTIEEKQQLLDNFDLEGEYRVSLSFALRSLADLRLAN